MATRILPGQRTWSMQRDAEGHRNYRITYRTQGASTDGPANHLLTPGLPVPGSVWAVDGDFDPWAFCHFDADVKPVVEHEPNEYFDIEFTFSTKPLRRCADQHFEDPLLEPAIVGGGFSNHQREGTRDRFGRPILTSSHELIRGPLNEWEVSYPIIRIRQNVATLQLPLLKAVIDRVNDAPLWGTDRREVRLNSVTWDQKYYGTCAYYYERNLEFHVKDGTFDRDLLDECSKVLNGHWDALTSNWVLDNVNGKAPNRFDPTHFIDFTDKQGNPIRGVLNGRGVPARVIVADPNAQRVKYISVVNGQVGQALSDATQWVPIDGDPTALPEWEPVTYNRGQIVHVTPAIGIAGGNYLATEFIQDFTAQPQDNDENVPGGEWLKLPANTPRARGTYDAAVTYNVGDYVDQPALLEEAEGMIHVEYYEEANFLLLGIPLTVGL